MPTSRRSVTYIVIALAVIVLAAVLYKTFPSSNATSQSAGVLDQAISNYAHPSSATGYTINGDGHYPAEIQSDGQTVVWYSGTTQFTTVVSSADAVTREFQTASFTNYKVDPAGGGNFLLSVILPNLILFGLMALILLWISAVLVPSITSPFVE